MMTARKWALGSMAGLSVFLLVANAPAGEPIATLRGGVEITDLPAAPAMTRQSNSSLRQSRNYPEQPPTIPHKTRGYEINLNSNKCMSCHSRIAVERSQAPMISITHFMDADNQVLTSVAARRYFCTQCHVPRYGSKTLVGNSFVDVQTLIKKDK